MLGHYLLTLYRSLSRHRLYAAINVLGLAVGIAVFLVLFLEVRFETSFERWIPGVERLYVLRSTFPGFSEMIYSEGALLDDLRHDLPKLEGARALSVDAKMVQGDHANSERLLQVDPNFFDLVDLPLATGAKAGALARPNNILISQKKAAQYFGGADPIGRSLNLKIDNVEHAYRVAAVLKDWPATTDEELRFDMLAPLTPAIIAANRDWHVKGDPSVITFLKLGEPAQAVAVDKDIARLIKAGPGDADSPWARMGLRVKSISVAGLHLISPVTTARVAAAGAVGTLTLLLAALNYVNLATARAVVRAREVAIRKVMGATAGTITVQFMAEAMAMAALSGLIGLALCELTLPLVNAASGLSLTMTYWGTDSILPAVIGVVLAVGVGAGLYPALVLARFQPALVLASVRTPGGGRMASRIREGLVLIQFAVAIAFTLAATVIVSQMAYLRHADLGFRREGLLVSTNFHDDNVNAAQRINVLAAWRSLPGVLGATEANIAPGVDDMTSATYVSKPGRPSETLVLNTVATGTDFFRVYGVRVLAGRLLDPAHAGDYRLRTEYNARPSDAEQAASKKLNESQPPPNVILNLSAAHALGYRRPQDAVGQHIESGTTIVGVIQDIRLRDPHMPVPPTMYCGQANDIRYADAVVRYSADGPRAVLALMREAWRKIVPNVPFDAEPDQTTLATYYRADDRNGRVLTIVSALAVLIGCVGLYGLASFNTARRVKEIGIRKTLGASTTDILKLLAGQFLRPVLLANLVAWPLAWWAMNGYLSGFDQRIALTPAYFLAATALTLLIAVATVAGQAYAVARAEPAKALRHE